MQSSESSNLQSNDPNRQSADNSVWITVMVWTLRLFVGAVFIIAGWAKCVDLWGSVIKIQEYLSAWHIDIPEALVNVGAAIMAGTELVLGVLLLCGCYRRVAVWLMLAFMAVFLPLTFYIWQSNPVSDCGCFGDFMILSNRDTFIKNILLTASLILLVFFNKRVSGVFVPLTQWIVGGVVSLYALIVISIGVYSQPLIDFRRFEPGAMIVASENTANDTEYLFVYSKDGETREFDMDNLPDSTWTFVDRKLINGTETVSDGFAAYDGDDEVSEESFSEGRVLLVTIPATERALPSATLIDDIAAHADACGISTYLILGGGEATVNNYVSDMMPTYPVLYAEPSLLKELARGDVALTMIEDGVILWKRNALSLSRSFLLNYNDCSFDDLAPFGRPFMWMLTILFSGGLVAFCLIDRGSLALFLLHRRRKMRKNKAT
ncbi:MAG: DoxX family membrane protein [Muribaculaceae bacterium]|nr:DoxX family membrane protein [Muribaculaceae bacterium]